MTSPIHIDHKQSHTTNPKGESGRAELREEERNHSQAIRGAQEEAAQEVYQFARNAYHDDFSCENGWKAGAAQIDITPERGIHLAGSIGIYRPLDGVLDPLFAKALILAKGDRRICMVQPDLLAIVLKYDAIFRARIADRFGFPPEAILLHCGQNHASPYVGNTYISDEYTDLPPELWFIRSGDDRYNPVAETGIMKGMNGPWQLYSP